MGIDFRSDTVTRPTKEMQAAMFAAEVGDDVFGEDPSVIALEHYAAKMFGKEAALFCPSGTMTNQIAIKLHTQPGGEVICDRLSHIYNYEGGGIAFNSLCSVRLLAGENGKLTAEEIAKNINPDDIHAAQTQLISLENTVNKGGGVCYNFSAFQEIKKVADANNLPLHLDGARLFNAIVKNNENPLDYGSVFDTISICLSKGLGAPVGSLLLGSAAHIKKARRIRKVFGGGMRQAGYLAAAGLYALQHHVDRLAEDHARAAILGDAVGQLSVTDYVLPVETNIVIFALKPHIVPATFLQALRERGILAVSMGGQNIRFVLHLDVNDEMLTEAIKVLKSL